MPAPPCSLPYLMAHAARACHAIPRLVSRFHAEAFYIIRLVSATRRSRWAGQQVRHREHYFDISRPQRGGATRRDAPAGRHDGRNAASMQGDDFSLDYIRRGCRRAAHTVRDTLVAATSHFMLPLSAMMATCSRRAQSHATMSSYCHAAKRR